MAQLQLVCTEATWAENQSTVCHGTGCCLSSCQQQTDAHVLSSTVWLEERCTTDYKRFERAWRIWHRHWLVIAESNFAWGEGGSHALSRWFEHSRGAVWHLRQPQRLSCSEWSKLPALTFGYFLVIFIGRCWIFFLLFQTVMRKTFMAWVHCHFSAEFCGWDDCDPHVVFPKGMAQTESSEDKFTVFGLPSEWPI